MTSPSPTPTPTPTPARQRNPRLAVTSLMAAASLLSGCAVVNVAGAAAGAAISVTGAVVASTVSVTGKVIGNTIDRVTPEAKRLTGQASGPP